jgi:hypothetical protein
MLKNILLLALALLLSACATGSGQGPPYFYNQILIVNNSKELIQEVTISSTVNGRSFSCGNIAPLGICSNRTGKRHYKEGPFQIDWVFGNNAPRTDQLTLTVPAFYLTGLALQVVFEISPQGEISAQLKQESLMR